MIESPWLAAKAIVGNRRVELGPVATHSWLHQPEHIAFQLARYRAAAALIGQAKTVLEMGCGEGIGAGILARGRRYYCGVDSDGEAISVARESRSGHIAFSELDFVQARWLPGTMYDATVALDVIEHIPAKQEDNFLQNATALLSVHGICVIGTPNAAFDHLASPQSKAGHINTYTHDRLHALMSEHFRIVQSFGMQDTALHMGHPEARHYLLMCGIGPRGR